MAHKTLGYVIVANETESRQRLFGAWPSQREAENMAREFQLRFPSMKACVCALVSMDEVSPVEAAPARPQ